MGHSPVQLTPHWPDPGVRFPLSLSCAVTSALRLVVSMHFSSYAMQGVMQGEGQEGLQGGMFHLTLSWGSSGCRRYNCRDGKSGGGWQKRSQLFPTGSSAWRRQSVKEQFVLPPTPAPGQQEECLHIPPQASAPAPQQLCPSSTQEPNSGAGTAAVVLASQGLLQPPVYMPCMYQGHDLTCSSPKRPPRRTQGSASSPGKSGAVMLWHPAGSRRQMCDTAPGTARNLQPRAEPSTLLCSPTISICMDSFTTALLPHGCSSSQSHIKFGALSEEWRLPR